LRVRRASTRPLTPSRACYDGHPTAQRVSICDQPTASVCQLVEAADGRQGDGGASGRMYALR
jgi:hypothetical protein